MTEQAVNLNLAVARLLCQHIHIVDSVLGFVPGQWPHSDAWSAGDALRPFLMHAFGGLYIDLDVQCFRCAEPSLLGHDIVLQSEYREGRDIVNSIMASVPGHPFWKVVITEMLEVRPSVGKDTTLVGCYVVCGVHCVLNAGHFPGAQHCRGAGGGHFMAIPAASVSLLASFRAL